MFTNRISKIFVVLLVLAIALTTVSFAARSANIPAADRSYDGVEQMRAQRSSAFVVAGKYDDRYDRMNALPNADPSYDKIEVLRLGR